MRGLNVMDKEFKYISDILDSDKDNKERYFFEQLKGQINLTKEERQEYFNMLAKNITNISGGSNNGNLN